MSIALLFQSIATAFRSVLFFFLALLRPFDMIADWFQKISFWLAVDNDVASLNIMNRGDKNDRRPDE
jgi:hypothetical protein